MSEPWYALSLIAALAYTTHRGFKEPSLKMQWAYQADRIRRGDRACLLTCGFMHLTWMNFAYNALAIFIFGGEVQRALGPLALLGIFLAGIVVGSLVSYWVRPQGSYLMWGSSGGSCALIFASLMMVPGSNVWMMPGWLFAIPFILISIYRIRSEFAFSGHVAHLGGMAAGATIGLVWLAIAGDPRDLGWREWLLAGLCAAGIYYLKKNPYANPAVNPFELAPVIAKAKKVASPTRFGEKPPLSETEVDRLLDKISSEGLQSLTREEREALERSSKSRGRT